MDQSNKSRKLNLKRETLMPLADDELGNVNGGISLSISIRRGPSVSWGPFSISVVRADSKPAGGGQGGGQGGDGPAYA